MMTRDENRSIAAVVEHVGTTKYERFCQPSLIVIAIALNVPPVVVGISVLATQPCKYYAGWFLANAGLCVINIVAAFYAVYKIRTHVKRAEDKFLAAAAVDHEEEIHDEVENEKDENDAVIDPENQPSSQEKLDSERIKERPHRVRNGELEQATMTSNDFSNRAHEDPEPFDPPSISVPSTSPHEARNSTSISESRQDRDEHHRRHSCFKRILNLRTTSSNRIRQLVCYDGICATYSILFLFWLFWLANGAQMQGAKDSTYDNSVDGCTDDHDRGVVVAIACGFTYITFVIVCLLASYLDTA